MRRIEELTIRHGNTVLQPRRSLGSDALLSLVEIRLDHHSHDLGGGGSGGELSGLGFRFGVGGEIEGRARNQSLETNER